jgi:hypothetical protein
VHGPIAKDSNNQKFKTNPLRQGSPNAISDTGSMGSRALLGLDQQPLE